MAIWRPQGDSNPNTTPRRPLLYIGLCKLTPLECGSRAVFNESGNSHPKIKIIKAFRNRVFTGGSNPKPIARRPLVHIGFSKLTPLECGSRAVLHTIHNLVPPSTSPTLDFDFMTHFFENASFVLRENKFFFSHSRTQVVIHAFLLNHITPSIGNF